jgi:hypothetical protein
MLYLISELLLWIIINNSYNIPSFFSSAFETKQNIAANTNKYFFMINFV